jgi:hypothetical protein
MQTGGIGLAGGLAIPVVGTEGGQPNAAKNPMKSNNLTPCARGRSATKQAYGKQVMAFL